MFFHRADIALQRLGNDGGLLKNLFKHEMAIGAFFNGGRRHARNRDSALYGLVLLVKNLRAITRDDHPITFIQIGNPLRQRGQSQSVRAQIGLPIPIADNQRRTEPCANEQIRMLAKSNRKCKGPAQLRQNSFHGLFHLFVRNCPASWTTIHYP